MPQKTNSFERFWKELKRRKVVHVITVYAAIAFVILQLVDMVSQPLHFPEWTQAFIIVLLCIGFVISVFVSWVYDITPTGVRKTKPLSELKHVKHPTQAVSSGWKTTTYISAVIIVALIAFNFIHKRNLNPDLSKLEKSIAVLPFINDSGSDSTTYFINGLMEEVLNSLQRIGSFSRVLSRTSTEKYRKTEKTIPEIAKELGVNYIVEGSGQKYGNSYRLRVQLIAANKEKHLWADSYEKEINVTTDIFNVQSKIAQTIASELKAAITPEEKRLIGKIPTNNLTAYDLILKAKDLYYKSFGENIMNFNKVSQLAYLALDLDTGFAQAYYWIGASSVSNINYYGYGKPFLYDTALYFFNRALQLDPSLTEAYSARGMFYYEKGQMQKAFDDLNKAITLSPGNSSGYTYLGYLYWQKRDLVNALLNLKKAEKLEKGDNELAIIYAEIWWVYISVGDWQKADIYFDKSQKLSKIIPGMDTWILTIRGKWEELVKLSEEKYHSKNLEALLALGKYQEAEACVLNNINSSPALNSGQRIGLAFWKNGKKNEAMKYFNRQIGICIKSIESKDPYGSTSAHYDLAGVYSVIGNKEEAYRWLREYEKQGFLLGTHEYIKVDPLFENLRNEEEFNQIVKRVNEKADSLRERINELEDQGILDK